MITIYTAPSCTSCKKAKTWLSYHHIPFNERNLIADPLSTTEISQILQKCDDGVEGLISSRNRFVKPLGVDFEDISLSQKRLHVGYNEEEIRAFLPRTVRVLENGGARLRSAI